GTGGEPNRPVGVAMVYETAGGEAYYLEDSGAAQLGASESTTPNESESSNLPTAAGQTARLDSLLEGLLPQVGAAAGGDPADAAGGLGLGDGGATLGGDRSIAKVKTSVFGIEGEGTRFLYVFDRSESMAGYQAAPLKAAKAELIKSIESLGPAHQFQIVFYNDSPLPFGGMKSGGPQMFKGEPASKLAATRFVRDISADGGTRHIDALRMALAMGPDVLFFLTDADSFPSSRELEDLHARAARAGTTLHTIQFGSGPNQHGGGWIRQLAETTLGKYRYIDVTQLKQR
ncbi:MAG: hypothetical protein KDA45_14715, partial [Planctomycetales bacterium]|nr:hypothetical protein [Planctomycetales bacterium]